MISVDRFDIVTPQGIGKGIKKEKILFGLVFMHARVSTRESSFQL